MPINRSCVYCATRFETTITKRIYCSDKCKTRFHRENALTCYYCGDLAETKDHIYPQSFGDGNGDVVKACFECNSLMNNHYPHSHELRIELLLKKLFNRYKLGKSVPEWADTEINELGHGLRAIIRGWVYKRQKAIERYIHIQARLHKIRADHDDPPQTLPLD